MVFIFPFIYGYILLRLESSDRLLLSAAILNYPKQKQTMSKRQKPDQKQLFHSLARDFHDLVSNKQTLRTAVEQFFNNLVDEMTLGIIFDLHRKFKTNAYELDAEDSLEEEDSSDVDIFAQQNMKKNQDCICPNCERPVAATRFAPHLETCMGMGRMCSRPLRNASRRVASNSKDRGDSSTYSEIPSDDEEEWSGDRKRSRKKDRNGSKKSRGTPKKLLEPEPVEPLNVDVEGDDDELTNLRDILHLQDHSNSTSPADSASSSGSTKKKDKSKKKSSNKQKDRNSPSSNVSAD